MTMNGAYRPAVGEWVLLVYRECVCGFWCATSEGSRAPKCPECDLPIPHPDRGEGPWSPDVPTGALGFAAQLLDETGGDVTAVGEVTRHGRRGVNEPPADRHYDPASVRAMAEKIAA